MRAFVLLILLAAAGYYLYSRHGASAAPPSGDELPSEIAWRMTSRDEHGGDTLVQIIAVSGNRWRVESTSPSKHRTLVFVSDGSAAAVSDPKAPRDAAASFDPRPPMRLLLKDLRHLSPEATEQIAGRPYLRFTQKVNGTPCQVWADPKTRFPFQMRALGTFSYFTVLPTLSDRDIPNIFSIHSLTPLLSRYATAQ